MISRLLRDPLVHFVLLGLVGFGAYSWVGSPDPGRDDAVRISATEIRRLAEGFRLTQGRAPAPDELSALVNAEVRRRVLYREALALGLDENDTVIRQRLIEKMQFLMQDTEVPPEPGEDELRSYLQAHREQFRVPATVSFEQIFFDPRRRGERALSDARSTLAGIANGRTAAAAVEGDRYIWRRVTHSLPLSAAEARFGMPFVTALTALPVGEWAGPLRSSSGIHLVKLTGLTDARDPTLEEVRDQVRAGYVKEAMKRLDDQKYRAISNRYRVLIDFPEDLLPDAGTVP